MTIYIIVYLLIMNAIGFIIMGIDKSRARNKKWRIKEKTLFLIAAIGGSLGCYIGMKRYRHKTKHSSFMIGIPFIFIIEVLICIAFYLLNKTNGIF